MCYAEELGFESSGNIFLFDLDPNPLFRYATDSYPTQASQSYVNVSTEQILVVRASA